MGIFWDIIQEEKISKQKAQTESLEQRVATLEEELAHTRSILRKTLIELENHLGKDIDGDGVTGE
ncbi:MAG: hypothetical protein KJP00_06785 [Bacteroidia bacterium]|nr:hypothetical protein [Bacteroidia bacterium]